MRRRELLLLVAGGAMAWPLGGQAQQQRRIGMLHDYSEGDPEGQAQVAAFRDELRKLGWSDGTTLRFEYRSAGDEHQQFAPSHPSVLPRGR